MREKPIDREHWRGKEYAFFSHINCEQFPCHVTGDMDSFNCLFCYCPLYSLGKDCGGDYLYQENGIKNCKNCIIPHNRDNYGYIIGRFEDIARKMEKEL